MCFFNTPTYDATCDGYVMVKKGMKKNMKSVVILGMCQWIWEVPLHDKNLQEMHFMPFVTRVTSCDGRVTGT